jgi:phytanoyl-CoA hydroxylase
VRRTIGAKEIEDFNRDGFVILDQILTPADMSVLLAAMDRVYKGEYNRDRRPPAVRKRVVPFGSQSSVQWVLNSRFLDGDLWEYATNERLGRAAAQLLRTSSVSIVEDQLLDKPPDGGRPVNMHQDYGYWLFSTSTQMITCWIALIDVTIDHGPLELIRGSHQWGAGPKPKELILGNENEWLAAVHSVKPDDAPMDLVPVTVQAGGGVFFHALTFHGSGRNNAHACRRACSLHWASEECRLDLSQTMSHDHPYMFAGLRNGGRIVNSYMPQVYSSSVL